MTIANTNTNQPALALTVPELLDTRVAVSIKVANPHTCVVGGEGKLCFFIYKRLFAPYNSYSSKNDLYHSLPVFCDG